jgi:thiol-disulfide isomerase/thioredoxin
MSFKACAFLFLTSACVAYAQAPYTDATALLDAVAKVYAADQNSFHFESVKETTFEDEYDRSWQKQVTVAIKGPDRGFRLEARSGFGDWLQVSDGTTEWMYLRGADLYTEQSAVGSPQFPKVFLPGMDGLRTAWDTPSLLQGEVLHAKSPALGPEEVIVVEGRSFPCFVIHAVYSGKGYNGEETFWIEKKTLLIRKLTQHGQTTLMLAGRAMIPRPMQTTTSFPVADLHPEVGAAAFSFQPPATAKEIATFTPDIRPPVNDGPHQSGGALPDLSLTSPEGKEIKLSSYRGKPLLIEVWATWCAPCMESMPSFGKLAKEVRTQGIEVITLDEDKTPEPPIRYLAAHGFDWPNYHDPEARLGHALAQTAVPLTVLADATGRITYISNETNDAALRKAIAALQIAGGSGL